MSVWLATHRRATVGPLVVSKGLGNVTGKRAVDGLGLLEFDLWRLASALDGPRLGGEGFAEMEGESTGSGEGAQSLFTWNNDFATSDNIAIRDQITVDARDDAVLPATHYLCGLAC